MVTDWVIYFPEISLAAEILCEVVGSCIQGEITPIKFATKINGHFPVTDILFMKGAAINSL